MPTTTHRRRFSRSSSARATAAGLALLAAGCASTPEELPVAPPPPAEFSYWAGEGVPGEPSVVIDLSEQAAYFYKGGALVARSRVATGTPGRSTPTGSYTILEKTVEKRSNLYGKIYDSSGSVVDSDADARSDTPPPGGYFQGASMPYWMRLTNRGVGMHAGPIPNPGSPASHGCIRMPRHMAVAFFENVSIGTPVEVVP